MDLSREESVAEAQRALELRWDMEAFLAGPVGKYLCDRAERERAAYLERLKDHDAGDARGIVNLQVAIKICDVWQDWIGEAIVDGRNAEQRIQDLLQD